LYGLGSHCHKRCGIKVHAVFEVGQFDLPGGRLSLARQRQAGACRFGRVVQEKSRSDGDIVQHLYLVSQFEFAHTARRVSTKA
jgi:hypothetical protein